MLNSCKILPLCMPKIQHTDLLIVLAKYSNLFAKNLRGELKWRSILFCIDFSEENLKRCINSGQGQENHKCDKNLCYRNSMDIWTFKFILHYTMDQKFILKGCVIANLCELNLVCSFIKYFSMEVNSNSNRQNES